MADVRWLADPARRGRRELADATATARWLASELRVAGYTPVMQAVGSHHNVIAVRGTGPAVLVIAHYDHLGVEGGQVYPGADDNASGVAVTLAVARVLAKSPPAQRVVFVFSALEEYGLVGAHAYVRAPEVPLAETRAVINLDMVGRNLFADATNQEAKLAAVGLPDAPELLAHATAAAQDAGLTLAPVSVNTLTLLLQDHRGDDWPFRDAGVPAVHFSSSVHDDYHQPTDTADKLVPAQLVRTAKLVLGILDRFAKSPTRAAIATDSP